MAVFVPPELTGRDVWIIEPSIDPFSPKNRPISRQRSRATLASLGLLAGEEAKFAGAVLGAARPLSQHDRLVVQVSRWDRLKDPLGVLEGFAEHVAGRSDVRLVLVGPTVEQIADDPEGAQVLAECLGAWETLPERVRNTIRLVALPMSDGTANARMVNAVQRRASVVVQKSIHEGFGLTVAESMWKSKPVVASAVGGIVPQVPPGTGLLLDDPNDRDAFGRTLVGLLDQPAEMHRLGRRAHQNVRANFLSDRHLIEYGRLLQHVSEF
jgi:trehalose synthase